MNQKIAIQQNIITYFGAKSLMFSTKMILSKHYNGIYYIKHFNIQFMCVIICIYICTHKFIKNKPIPVYTNCYIKRFYVIYIIIYT